MGNFISQYKKPENMYSKPIDTASPEFKMSMIKQLATIRYGKRGNSYYMQAAISDIDVIERLKREHVSVNGFSYYEIINKMYNVLFN